MNHKIFRFNSIVLLLAIVSFGVIAIMLPPSTTNQPYVFQKPLDVIHLFYDSVDRNELKVFNITINKNNLIPTHVDYSYNLSNSVPVIKVHCQLKEPIPLPKQEGLFISSVTTIMENGSIIDSIAHVSISEEKQ